MHARLPTFSRRRANGGLRQQFKGRGGTCFVLAAPELRIARRTTNAVGWGRWKHEMATRRRPVHAGRLLLSLGMIRPKSTNPDAPRLSGRPRMIGPERDSDEPYSLFVPHRHVGHGWRASHRALGRHRGRPVSDGNLSGCGRAMARNGHHIAARGTGNRGQSADPNGFLGRQGPPGRALETLRRSGYDARLTTRRCPRQGNAMTVE